MTTYLDLEAASLLLSEGGGVVESLGVAFGVPQCLMDLGQSKLYS